MVCVLLKMLWYIYCKYIWHEIAYFRQMEKINWLEYTTKIALSTNTCWKTTHRLQVQTDLFIDYNGCDLILYHLDLFCFSCWKQFSNAILTLSPHYLVPGWRPGSKGWWGGYFNSFSAMSAYIIMTSKSRNTSGVVYVVREFLSIRIWPRPSPG